jgi:hypothetical protein
MQRSYFPAHILVLLFVGVILVVINVDSMWSISVDLAHHYALAFRIAENWQLTPNDPTLGEMNYYPKVSHVLAAITGLVFNSTFLGIQLVALASLAMLWGAYLAIMCTLPGQAARISALMLAILVFLNTSYGALDLHGGEIVGNFFFSQLVAQAFCVIAIALAIHIEARAGKASVYFFLLVGIYVVTLVHLLPGLELLGVLIGLLVIDNLTLKTGLASRLRIAASSGIIALIAVGSVVCSETFTAMRQISENNGRLVLQHIESQTALTVLCLVGIAAAIGMLYLWRRGGQHHLPLKYLAAYGGTISVLCLLQNLLLRFHLGSEYAVKKYAFGISSFLIVALAIFIGMIVVRWWKPKAGTGNGIVSAVVLATAMAGTFSYCARTVKLADTSDVVAIERQLISLRDSALSAPIPGKTDIVIDLKDLPSVVDYMFSIAIVRTPRSVAGPDLLEGYKLGPIDRYRTIISSRGSSRYELRECSLSQSSPLLTIDAACLKKAIVAASVCKEILDFSIKGDMEVSMLSGFSVPEPESRWTDGTRATITCTAQKTFKVARIKLAPFLPSGQPRQRVAFSVNGGPPVRYEFTKSMDSTVLELPLPKMIPGEQMVFTLDIPDAVSPQELKIGDDGRRLGLAVRTITFE